MSNDFLNIGDALARLKAQIENPLKFEAPPEGVYRPEPTCAPDCEICGGTGLIRPDRPVGHPDFGQLEPCPNLPIEKQAARWRNGLSIREQNELTWSVLLPLNVIAVINGARETKTTADKVALAIQDKLRRGWGWVFLYGSFGLAKSLYLKIAVAESLRRGQAAVYTDVSDIIDNLRDAYDQNDPRESAGRRLENWSTVPVLAIDEMDKMRRNDYSEEKLFQLMNRRYQAALRRETVTLMASNKPPSDLPGYLKSRIGDGRFVCVEIQGEDARPGMTDDYLF